MSMESDRMSLLNEIGGRLQKPYSFSLKQNEIDLPADHPLCREVSAILAGDAGSLPYIGSTDVTWVTFGASEEKLREKISILRSWILPSFGWEATPSVVVPGSGVGGLSAKIFAISPSGYFRWMCTFANLQFVVGKLQSARSLNAKAPPRVSRSRPTLELLRQNFTLATATGDYSLALASVDEIDRRQLDTAVNALSMRIRLHDAFGEYLAIVENQSLEFLLTFPLPRRVGAAVVRAHHIALLQGSETRGELEVASKIYKDVVHARLSGLSADVYDESDLSLTRMAAYGAWADRDLASLLQFDAHDTVVEFLVRDLKQSLGAQEVQSPPVSIEAEARVIEWEDAWSKLREAVLSQERGLLDCILRRINSEPDEASESIGDGALLLEIFLDDKILESTEARSRSEVILTSIIDAYVCEPSFPHASKRSLYCTILDVWCFIKSSSNDVADGQLMLMLAEAILTLDGTTENLISDRISRWWKARPVRTRLPWLSEALECLTEQSASKEYLGLWYDAASLLHEDCSACSPREMQRWVKIGRRLGLERSTAYSALGIVDGSKEVEVRDPLSGAGLRKIAIVSLHEKTAREAAQEIQERTGANVLVVSEHAAGDATRSATSADVVLFVWGAAKHAVFRAFDKVRDRLEYVQGTGSGSIVRALERRVARTILE
jgi:hypothetical protein